MDVDIMDCIAYIVIAACSISHFAKTLKIDIDLY